jgi:glycosyltransferase involved in cell wall biosynthesis
MKTTDSVERNVSVPSRTTAHAPLLTLVVPIYNEESVLRLLLPRLKGALDQIDDEYEIIFVNDGSTDQSLAILEEMHAEDSRIKILSFSRNFGKECAITAGLDFASGQAVVPIDADLQDPPELIVEFVEHWRNGYKIVNGVRRRRSED